MFSLPVFARGQTVLTCCFSLPQIHSRYEGKKTSKHKRNLAITGGVTLSVIASPVIAAVSVGKWAQPRFPSTTESPYPKETFPSARHSSALSPS